MADDKLTQGMASTGHILLGNHEIIHTNGSTPVDEIIHPLSSLAMFGFKFAHMHKYEICGSVTTTK